MRCDLLSKLANSSGLWTILGVVVGFGLGEGSRLLRHLLRVRKLKRILREELSSIHAQIPQKQDIVNKMIDSLKQGRLLPGISVAALTTGYTQYASELYGYLSRLERNCLHVIYERLRIAEALLTRFEAEYLKAKKEGVVTDPSRTWQVRLKELNESYDLVRELISGCLKGTPVDAFAVDEVKG